MTQRDGTQCAARIIYAPLAALAASTALISSLTLMASCFVGTYTIHAHTTTIVGKSQETTW